MNYFNYEFLDNKYTKWYIKIVENALLRTQTYNAYVEKHHIIPRSFGGIDGPSNLVTLFAREHYIVHLLLPKMVNGNNKYKMQVALWNMMAKSKNRYIPNNKQYETIKENMAIALSVLHKGKESKLKGRPNNKIPWNKGLSGISRLYSEEGIKKLKSPKSEETKKKISQSLKKYNVQRKKIGNAAPRIRFILKNIITDEIVETTNITKWCQEKGFNSSWLYRNKSSWKIVEKYNIKDGSKIL